MSKIQEHHTMSSFCSILLKPENPLFLYNQNFFNSGLVAFRMLTDMTNHLQHCGIVGFNSSNPALSTLSWLDTVSSGQQVFARDLRSMTGSSPT